MYVAYQLARLSHLLILDSNFLVSSACISLHRYYLFRIYGYTIETRPYFTFNNQYLAHIQNGPGGSGVLTTNHSALFCRHLSYPLLPYRCRFVDAAPACLAHSGLNTHTLARVNC